VETISEEHFAIDPANVEEEKRFYGIFGLRTNTDLNPLAAMLCYKQLWTVEQTFHTTKHLFATRPIFHKLDETIRGHVFCSFLAPVLRKALEGRIAALDRTGSWPEIIADLDSLTETEIEHDGKRFIVRSAPRRAATLALRAAGVALPPTVCEADSIDSSMISSHNAIRRPLACSPADSSFGWCYFGRECHVRIQLGSSGVPAYVISLGPDEGWIALKRNVVALAVFERLRPDVGEMAIREFARLFGSGLSRDSSDLHRTNLADTRFATASPLLAARILRVFSICAVWRSFLS